MTMGRVLLTLVLVCNAASSAATPPTSPGIRQKHTVYLMIRPIKPTMDGQGGEIFRCFPSGPVGTP